MHLEPHVPPDADSGAAEKPAKRAPARKGGKAGAGKVAKGAKQRGGGGAHRGLDLLQQACGILNDSEAEDEEGDGFASDASE